MEADKKVKRLLTTKIHMQFSDIFIGISCYGGFEGTFKLWMREGSYQLLAPPRIVVYALQKPLQEDLDKLQKQQIIVPLDIDETSESEMFKHFSRQTNIQQPISSSYHHESNRQVEVCINLLSIRLKCLDTNRDIHLALL